MKISLAGNAGRAEEAVLYFRQLALGLRHGADLQRVTTLLAALPWRDLASDAKAIAGSVAAGTALDQAAGARFTGAAAGASSLLTASRSAADMGQLAELYARDLERKTAFRRLYDGTALRGYALLALAVGGVVLLLIFFSVLPAYEKFYDSLGAQLPLLTRIALPIAGLLAGAAVALLVAIKLAAGGGSAPAAWVARWGPVRKVNAAQRESRVALLRRDALEVGVDAALLGAALSQDPEFAAAADPGHSGSLTAWSAFGEAVGAPGEVIAEVAPHLEAQAVALTARFARRTDLAIYALVATAIGLVVVGFYLPIFALGQAI